MSLAALCCMYHTNNLHANPLPLDEVLYHNNFPKKIIHKNAVMVIHKNFLMFIPNNFQKCLFIRISKDVYS